MENKIEKINEITTADTLHDTLLERSRAIQTISAIEKQIKDTTNDLVSKKTLMSSQLSGMALLIGENPEDGEKLKSILDEFSKEDLEMCMASEDSKTEFIKIFDGLEFAMFDMISDTREEKIDFLYNLVNFNLEANETNIELNEAMEKFESETSKLMDEAKSIVDAIPFTSSELMGQIAKLRLEEILNNNEVDEETKEKMKGVLTTHFEILDDALSLKNIVAFYESGQVKAANVLRDFKDTSKHEQLLRKYRVIAAKAKIGGTIFKFPRWETMVDSKFEKVSHLASFLILRMITGGSEITKETALFLTQLAANINDLKLGYMRDYEQEKLVEGLEKLFVAIGVEL